MPDSSLGFTGNEIIAHVQQYIGNYATDLQLFLQNSLPLAESRYCKAHDWTFLNKQNLALTVVSGTSTATLNVASIGYYMAASNVKEIFSIAGNRVLKKTDLQTIRRMNPKEDAGTTTSYITHWAPIGDNQIIFYPPIFADTVLQIDGEVTPNSLYTLTNYPTIPARYQESFIEYVKWIALDRENDDRAGAKLQYAGKALIEDLADDLSGIGEVDQPRIKSALEAITDGTGADLVSLYNLWAFSSLD